MSRSGYHKLEQSLMMEKEQLRQGTASEIDTGVSEPQSPPTRYHKWKMALIKKLGTYSSEQSRIVPEKIVSYFYALLHLF